MNAWCLEIRIRALKIKKRDHREDDRQPLYRKRHECGRVYEARQAPQASLEAHRVSTQACWLLLEALKVEQEEGTESVHVVFEGAPRVHQEEGDARAPFGARE
jgi:hypothetical protein